MKKPRRWLPVIGFLLWMSWKVFFQVGWLEFSIGFSLFILVPLLLEEVVQTSEGNLAERWLWGVMKCSLPFAVAGALSLTVPAGLEAVAWSAVWLVYTLLVAYGGLARMFGRGKSGLEEWSIDVGRFAFLRKLILPLQLLAGIFSYFLDIYMESAILISEGL